REIAPHRIPTQSATAPSPPGGSSDCGCSRHRIPAGGQSIQLTRPYASLKLSGFVGTRRQQSAGFGPPFSECKRAPWARGDFGSRRALALARAAVHCKDEAKVETKVQTKAEASPPGL